MYSIVAFWIHVFIVHADEQGETSVGARRSGMVWKSIYHVVIRISIIKIPGWSLAVIQVLAVMLNAETDTQKLCALLHGERVKDNLRNKLNTSLTAQRYCKIEVRLQSCSLWLKIPVIRKPCQLVNSCQTLEGTDCLHLHRRKYNVMISYRNVMLW